MRKLSDMELALLKVLKQHDGLYDSDEELEPFWDWSGGKPDSPDILGRCCELGLVRSEIANHRDFFLLTAEGKKTLRCCGR